MTIAIATINKLGKLFPRLASDHDGEVIATARAIIRTLESAGSSLHDLAGEMQPKLRERIVYREPPKPKKPRKEKPAPPPEPPRPEPSPRGKFVPFEDVLEYAPALLEKDLNDKEKDFVLQVLTWAERFKSKFTLTERQADWWRRLLVENDIPISKGPAA